LFFFFPSIKVFGVVPHLLPGATQPHGTTIPLSGFFYAFPPTNFYLLGPQSLLVGLTSFFPPLSCFFHILERKTMLPCPFLIVVQNPRCPPNASTWLFCPDKKTSSSSFGLTIGFPFPQVIWGSFRLCLPPLPPPPPSHPDLGRGSLLTISHGLVGDGHLQFSNPPISCGPDFFSIFWWLGLLKIPSFWGGAAPFFAFPVPWKNYPDQRFHRGVGVTPRKGVEENCPFVYHPPQFLLFFIKGGALLPPLDMKLSSSQQPPLPLYKGRALDYRWFGQK